MIVTINIDASFCPLLKVGGFAYWIKSNIGTLSSSGPIKNPLTPEDAELKAMDGESFFMVFTANKVGWIK